MRRTAIIVGWVWLALCAAAWVATGFVDLDRVDLPPVIANWSTVGLLQSGGWGLSFACLIAAIPGFALLRWGRTADSIDA